MKRKLRDEGLDVLPPALEIRRCVERFFDSLSELGSEAEVVRAKNYRGLTFESIGERLQCSPNTVKTRYYRAILKLKDHLRGRYPELFGEDEQ